MKRDMDLARKILEQVEEKHDDQTQIALDLPDYPEKLVHYHIMLLNKAGLLEAADCSGSESGTFWIPVNLTWNGHEFLDAIRNETVWNKVKEVVKEKGGSIPFEVLKTLAVQFAGSVFGVGS